MNLMQPSLYLLAEQQSDPILGMLVPMVLIAGIFYFLIFRPMRKRQKQTDSMIANLQNGDKVVTTGGIYGTVAGLKDKTVLVKIADNVKIEVAKNAIAGLQAAPPEEK